MALLVPWNTLLCTYVFVRFEVITQLLRLALPFFFLFLGNRPILTVENVSHQPNDANTK